MSLRTANKGTVRSHDSAIRFSVPEIDFLFAESVQRSREDKEWIEHFGEIVAVIDKAAPVVNECVGKDPVRWPKRWPDWPDWSVNTVDTHQNIARVAQFMSTSYFEFSPMFKKLGRSDEYMKFKGDYEYAKKIARYVNNVWRNGHFNAACKVEYTKLVKQKWGAESKQYELFIGMTMYR